MTRQLFTLTGKLIDAVYLANQVNTNINYKPELEALIIYELEALHNDAQQLVNKLNQIIISQHDAVFNPQPYGDSAIED